MTSRRPSTAAPVVTVLAVVLVTLGMYVGGYFWMGTRRVWISARVSSTGEQVLDAVERTYPNQFFATLYRPAGWIEEQYIGINVLILDEDSDGPYPPSRTVPTKRTKAR